MSLRGTFVHFGLKQTRVIKNVTVKAEKKSWVSRFTGKSNTDSKDQLTLKIGLNHQTTRV